MVCADSGDLLRQSGMLVCAVAASAVGRELCQSVWCMWVLVSSACVAGLGCSASVTSVRGHELSKCMWFMLLVQRSSASLRSLPHSCSSCEDICLSSFTFWIPTTHSTLTRAPQVVYDNPLGMLSPTFYCTHCFMLLHPSPTTSFAFRL